MGKAYLILSGKGGVGKTTIATSLALELAARGLSVALVDADIENSLRGSAMICKAKSCSTRAMCWKSAAR